VRPSAGDGRFEDTYIRLPVAKTELSDDEESSADCEIDIDVTPTLFSIGLAVEAAPMLGATSAPERVSVVAVVESDDSPLGETTETCCV